MDRSIAISGSYTLNGIKDSFKGSINISEGDDSFYYCWNLYKKNGEFIGGRCRPVWFRQIPDEENKIEFVIQQALENIRTFRVGREKIIKELYFEN